MDSFALMLAFTLSLHIVQGVVLGVVPSLLTRTKSPSRLAFDVGFAIGGAIAMAWFLTPSSLETGPLGLARPGLLTVLGSTFALALGRLFWPWAVARCRRGLAASATNSRLTRSGAGRWR